VQKRLVWVYEGSLCLKKLLDVSGPGLVEAGRYSRARLVPYCTVRAIKGSNDGGVPARYVRVLELLLSTSPAAVKNACRRALGSSSLFLR
jgi:hypothetical protein